MRRARANHGRQAAVAAAMVAAVIDAATADNAAAVNRLNPLIIFVKAVAPATAFLFHHGCARLEERTTIKPQRFKEGVPIMPDDTNAKENIEIPPIPKETAGAVTGAVIGSMIGPGGSVRPRKRRSRALLNPHRRDRDRRKLRGAKPRKENLRNRASDRPPNGQKPNHAEDRHRVSKKGGVAEWPIRKVGRAGFEPAKA